MDIKKNEREIELAKIARQIEDDIDNLDLIEREAHHIAELTMADEELTRRKIMAMRHLEKIERKKAQRIRPRLLFIILIYVCGIDELRAMALVSMMDDHSEPGGGVGVGIV